MNPRRLHELLDTAAGLPPAEGSRERSAAVWAHIRRGWDPERIEWQAWLRRWWPAVLAVVVAVSFAVASLPHGTHGDEPPPLGLFGIQASPVPPP